ncbi:hypothetical protein LTR72_007746, partial [Exophiala xenobiotica]
TQIFHNLATISALLPHTPSRRPWHSSRCVRSRLQISRRLAPPAYSRRCRLRPARMEREHARQADFPYVLRRVLLVAGFVLLPRCYAFRFGAGAEFEGCLTTALRNFVM